MQVVVDVPEKLAEWLGQDPKALSQSALEALILESLREGRISTAQARVALGIRTRQGMDAFLKAHKFDLPITIEQVRRDSDAALSFSK